MSKDFKQWIYHSTEEPKVIHSKDADKHFKEGWADTPAKFAKIVDFGVDEKDPAAVQVLGEALEGVKERLNGELNISVMKKKELEEFALTHFNVTLNKRRSLAALQKEVYDLIKG